jgi:hypothetical protein
MFREKVRVLKLYVRALSQARKLVFCFYARGSFIQIPRLSGAGREQINYHLRGLPADVKLYELLFQ